MRSSNVTLASEVAPSAETWSVSRTSNFFLVGLLLPILAAKALCFPRHLVIGHGANSAPPLGRLTQQSFSPVRPHVVPVSATCPESKRLPPRLGKQSAGSVESRPFASSRNQAIIQAPQIISSMPVMRPSHRPLGTAFSRSTRTVSNATHHIFMTPATNNNAMRSQQQPAQYAPC